MPIKQTLRHICCAAAVVAPAALWPLGAAAQSDYDGSSPAYSFLNNSSSSRIFGLGGINITTIDPDDINTIDQNPALQGPEFGSQIGINYMRWLGESNFAGVRFGMGAGEHGAWSAAIQYFGYGSMKQTDADGTIIGDFSPSDITFSGSYCHDLTGLLRGGFAIKFAYSHYGDYSALAMATDLGLNYYDPDRDLSMSVVVANLGGQVKRFQDTYDRLPIDVRLGWSKSFGSLPIRFSVTAWNLTRWRLPYYDTGDGASDSTPQLKDSFGSNLMRHLVFGADFIPSEKFSVSLGYNYKTRTDMAVYSRSFLSGFSLAAGLKAGAFGVGVAFAQPHAGATTMMLNLTANIYDLTH